MPFAWQFDMVGCSRWPGIRSRCKCVAAAIVATAAGSNHAHAADYTLLSGSDSALRADVAWLVDRRILSLPLATWPLPERTLRVAVANRRPGPLGSMDRIALSRVEEALARAQWPAYAFAGLNSASHPDLTAAGGVRGRARGGIGVQGGEGAIGGQLRLSALADSLGDGGAWQVLDGSYAAVGTAEAMAWAGVVDRHWGPGVFGSPVLSNAASPVPVVALRRVADDAPQTPWLRWIGPWGYELSLGELQHYDPAHTLLTGIRLYARPVRGLELGLARSFQWGGRGRPRGLDAFWEALWGRTADNDERGADASNEVAGFDLRWSALTEGGTPWVLSGQFVGEDVASSGALPLKYFGTIGLQVKPVGESGRYEWTIEAMDTTYGRNFNPFDDDGCRPAYRHDQYVDGYYHRRLPLGAAIGGGGEAFQIGVAWVPLASRAVERVSAIASTAHLNRCGPEPLNAAFYDPGRLNAFSLRIEGSDPDWRWMVGLSLQRAPGDPRPRGAVLASVELRL